MSLITDIRELAKTSRQAALDVAGTVMDVRSAATVFQNPSKNDARIAQAQAQAVPYSPTFSTQSAATDAGMGMSFGKVSPVMLLAGVVVLFFLMRGR